MYRRLLWGAALLLLISLIACLPRLLFVPWISQELEEFVASELRAESIAVDLPGSGWALLLGYIPKVEVQIGQGDVSGFPVTEAHLSAEGLRFHPWALFREQEFYYGGAQFLQISARVTAESLSEYFREQVPEVGNLVAEAEGGQLRIGGTVEVLGVLWNIGLSGTIQVKDRSVLAFVPVALQLEQAFAPPALVELLQEYFRIEVDLDRFPFPIRIVRAEVEGGGITLVVEEVLE
ncbi:MAG: DUF2993 domain-containing protein [Limnochordia bacterium]|nr:MAG: hypothetical protein AA931_00520 [Peptococcaceae bacterium 1109]